MRERNIDMKAQIFNIQRFCTDDGDGIRTTVFFKGCPLRCLWCHNPESWDSRPQMSFTAKNCMLCGVCAAICPEKCHRVTAHGHDFDRTCCIRCGRCAEVCSTASLETVGKAYTVDEVVRIALKDRDYYGDKGGVTLSGGEPMLQAAFAVRLAKALKEQGISVYIETGGYGKKGDFEAILPYCDRFLFDIKALPEDYPALVGAPFSGIEDNLALLHGKGAAITLRCPIIAEFNAKNAHYENIAALALRYGADAVELLPYHKLGLDKGAQVGNTLQRCYTAPTAEELTAAAVLIQKQTGLQVMTH